MKLFELAKQIILACIPNFLLKYPLVKRLIGFSFVGVVITFIGMLQVYILLKVLHFHPYLTYFLSYVISILQSYYLNSRLVFKSGKSKKNLFIYYGVYSTSMIIGFFTLVLYRKFLPFDELILNYMVIPVTMLWNFTVSSKFLKPQEIQNITEIDIE
ncbi:MAG TPA: GtrA family protein [Bacteroidales bacterium]|nr:GtrA family protein [Bacteroidales bacterium]